MTQTNLSTDEFLTQLATLIARAQQKGHGSIHLSQKRMTHDSVKSAENAPSDDPLSDLHLDHPVPIIVRATDGRSQTEDRKKNKNKIKLSTIVQPADIEAFFARYAEVCKGEMHSLKKRDRSKRKKDKSKKKKQKTAPEDKKV